jgi:twitching motility protein PilT
MLLETALREVIARDGTDLVLTSGNSPLVRVEGKMQRTELPVLDVAAVEQLVHELLDADQRKQLEIDRDIDLSLGFEDRRFRGNIFFQREHPAISLRLLQSRIPSFDEIGLPPVVRDLITAKQGFILFTGPTGSGKTTSMATLVDAINANRPAHVITIEDPIEYLHEDQQAVVHQREVGTDATSFARALRAALREDPDVVLVGEMRDPETMAITLTLAETGHLVLSSLHTNDAPQALDRIVDSFSAEQQGQIRLQLASTLTAVVAQRLVPRIGGGLVAAYEVLLANTAVSNLIREGKTRQLRNAMQMDMASGNCTLEMSLNHLVATGAITHETALATAFMPHEIAPPPVSANGQHEMAGAVATSSLAS